MTLAETYSWIFYAIGVSSHTSPVKQKEIFQVADGINHAVPTQKEMQASISWLIKENMIQKNGKSVQPTESGRSLLDKASSTSNTTSGVWKNLTDEFSNMGVDNTQEVNPNNINT
jgi:hypothetical protein